MICQDFINKSMKDTQLSRNVIVFFRQMPAMA